VIREAALAQARARQHALAEKLRQLTDARARVVKRLQEYGRYVERFEAGLAAARESGEAWLLPVYSVSPWTRKASVGESLIAPDNHRRIAQERASWARAIDRLTDLRERLDRKIKELHERKFRVDLWIIEKEETWGKIDPEKLKGQIREIVRAAEELSQLIVGRQVPIAFDTRDESPAAGSWCWC
jgi:predicted nuclease with TOPRIM domain